MPKREKILLKVGEGRGKESGRKRRKRWQIRQR
jgi:hypothetical protein